VLLDCMAPMQPSIAPCWLRVSLVAAAVAAGLCTDALAQYGRGPYTPPPPVITPPPVTTPGIPSPGIPTTPAPCPTGTPTSPPVITPPVYTPPPVVPPPPTYGRTGYVSPAPTQPGAPSGLGSSANYAAPSYMVPGSALGSTTHSPLGAAAGTSSRARSMLPPSVAGVARPALDPYGRGGSPTPTPLPPPPTVQPPTTVTSPVVPCTTVPPPNGGPIVVVTGPGTTIHPPVIRGPGNRVPEPGTLALLLTALGSVALVARRRRPSVQR